MNPSPVGASAEELVLRLLLQLIVLGVLPPSMFTKLVIMAIAGTLIARPLIRRFTRGQERPVSIAGESAAA